MEEGDYGRVCTVEVYQYGKRIAKIKNVYNIEFSCENGVISLTTDSFGNVRKFVGHGLSYTEK